MKNIRSLLIILLFFIGLNALTGGALLMMDPSGALMHLSIEQVEPMIFDDFMIPGMLLFFFNGILSSLTGFSVLFHWKHYAELVILQGMILFTWITMQIFFFEQIFYVQYIVAGIGLVFFVFGIRLRQMQVPVHRQPKHRS